MVGQSLVTKKKAKRRTQGENEHWGPGPSTDTDGSTGRDAKEQNATGPSREGTGENVRVLLDALPDGRVLHHIDAAEVAT